jgi:hypothetical protein
MCGHIFRRKLGQYQLILFKTSFERKGLQRKLLFSRARRTAGKFSITNSISGVAGLTHSVPPPAGSNWAQPLPNLTRRPDIARAALAKAFAIEFDVKAQLDNR